VHMAMQTQSAEPVVGYEPREGLLAMQRVERERECVTLQA
jgi:hypothetical protein